MTQGVLEQQPATAGSTATAAPTKYVYFFGGGSADGNGRMKDTLGGKGAGLAEMTSAGLPVPPGFTIQTEACREYMRNAPSKQMESDMLEALARLERLQGQKLGAGDNPLLVSVRSGAKFSMPGMMDTILNLGLNDKAVEALAKRSNNPRFAYDSYRRLIQMFSDVVLDVPKKKFEHIFDGVKARKKVHFDYDLQPDALKEIIAEYKKLVKKETGKDFPQNPVEQLAAARDAVFRSWQNDRAKTYRRINNIDDRIGTAVNVQAMVFGNLGENSGTGVGFTRNPATGDRAFFGEYLMNAQGEDVVSGVRTPMPISELEKAMPKVYEQLRTITGKMEKHYRDMQDFEFTIQDGKLYMLQTRNGKRTGLAAVKLAIDMVDEGLITKEEAVFRVEPNQLYDFLVPRLVEKGEKIEVLATGLPASPGAAVGQIVFTAEDAV
ncbi:MAG TPA: PEP/pyruvate-binding domain-containing protein, partial [Terracidiphilus sp.]|nr:PEP/pyruvate-binding domain-containing protein [Terracidiphilus sp.]